ncbi:tRNA-intron lyase [Candidatus Woesearchaeota archaeon]|nr:tRNA-intron lyase [Candidatus Woesearchaeota archaeon]
MAEESEEKKTKNPDINGVQIGERVLIDKSDPSLDLYNKSRFGEWVEDKLQISLIEALYLVEKKKITLKSSLGRRISYEALLKRIQKKEQNLWVKYCVYRDMRNRGYIVKTALKFGADFRVYDRGVKPGEDHAKWVLYPVHEGATMTWHDFSAKNRVAHSTRKRLLIGVVDEENDVTYYQIAWTRP